MTISTSTAVTEEQFHVRGDVSHALDGNPLSVHDLDTGAGDQDVSDETGHASDALHIRAGAHRNARVNILSD